MVVVATSGRLILIARPVITAVDVGIKAFYCRLSMPSSCNCRQRRSTDSECCLLLEKDSRERMEFVRFFQGCKHLHP